MKSWDSAYYQPLSLLFFMSFIPKCLIIKLGVLWNSKCQPPVAVMLAPIPLVTLNCHCWPEVCLHLKPWLLLLLLLLPSPANTADWFFFSGIWTRKMGILFLEMCHVAWLLPKCDLFGHILKYIWCQLQTSSVYTTFKNHFMFPLLELLQYNVNTNTHMCFQI